MLRGRNELLRQICPRGAARVSPGVKNTQASDFRMILGSEYLAGSGCKDLGGCLPGDLALCSFPGLQLSCSLPRCGTVLVLIYSLTGAGLVSCSCSPRTDALPDWGNKY